MLGYFLFFPCLYTIEMSMLMLIVSFETLGHSIFTIFAKIYHLNLRGELLCLLFQSKHVPEFKDLQMTAFISLDLNEGRDEETK